MVVVDIVVVLAALVRLLVRLLVHQLTKVTQILKLAYTVLQILEKEKVDMLFIRTTTIFLITKIIFITKGITSKVKVCYLVNLLLTLQ